MADKTREDNLFNFLLYSYFKITRKDYEAAKGADKNAKKEIAEKCAKRAYLDFNRTLRFEKGKHGPLDSKPIVDEVEKVMDNPNGFDKNHGDSIDAAIDSIWKTVKEETVDNQKLLKEFHYGQAQKWLNMTIKYMWLLGLWEKDKPHIPLDSYILKKYPKNRSIAINEIDWNNNYIEKIDIDSEGKINIQYKSKSKKVSWSKIPCKEVYQAIQSEIKECIPTGKPPLEWENEEWLRAAQKKIDT